MCKADALPEPSSGGAAAVPKPSSELPFKGPPQKKAKGEAVVVTAKVNHPFTEPKSTEVSAVAASSSGASGSDAAATARATEAPQDHMFQFAKRVKLIKFDGRHVWCSCCMYMRVRTALHVAVLVTSQHQIH